jgi:RHS repeat-associated protein
VGVDFLTLDHYIVVCIDFIVCWYIVLYVLPASLFLLARKSIRNSNIGERSLTYIVSTHTYSGSYEIEDDQTGNPMQVHYIGGIAMVTMDHTGTISEYYTYTDQLGSILTVTDASATVVAQQNFDAWGRNRNPADWTYASIPTVPSWLYRGYTGHEMLPQFALINMNGRMYDPILGRMLSADNVIHDPTGTQYYNRYSYAFNNPLKYTDPTGWDGDDITWGEVDALSADGQSGSGGASWSSFVSSLFGVSGGSGWQGPGSNSAFGTFSATDWANTVAYLNSPLFGETSPDGDPSANPKGINGPAGNSNGVGAIVYVYVGGVQQAQIQNPDGTVTLLDPQTALEQSNPSVGVYANNTPVDPTLMASAGGGWPTSLGLFADWLAGNNGDRFFNNDDFAKGMLSSDLVHDATNNYYLYGKTSGYENFGMIGAINAGTDATQQFIGGFKYTIDDQYDANNLVMFINNQTSFSSFLYHIWPSSWNWSNGPMGNFNQTYIIYIPK